MYERRSASIGGAVSVDSGTLVSTEAVSDSHVSPAWKAANNRTGSSYQSTWPPLAVVLFSSVVDIRFSFPDCPSPESARSNGVPKWLALAMI